MPAWKTGVLRDTRANQPTPTADQGGILYWVTDEEVLERWSGSAWQAYSVEPIINPMLAYGSYGGGDADTTSTSLADADATNLAVTFTVPSTGKVLVRLTATAAVNANSAGSIGNQYWWGLREATTDIEAGNIVLRAPAAGSTVAQYIGATKAFVRTGLTPAASLTYKWAHKVSDGSGSGRIVCQSGSPAVMEVWALP